MKKYKRREREDGTTEKSSVQVVIRGITRMSLHFRHSRMSGGGDGKK